VSVKGNPDKWLEQQEVEVNRGLAITPGTEKRILWFDPNRKSKTQWSIVYLHGFSATRQEIAPVGEMLAKRLGANLFETRLKGHGHKSTPLTNVYAEDWLFDAAEALAIGREIGEKIILMGTSTGATLAMAMVNHPDFEKVDTLVLVSPNFGVADQSSELLTLPGGLQLAYLLVGRTRSWETGIPLQEQFWSTSYPMDAALEVMRLVQFVRRQLPVEIPQSVLMFYSPKDRVIDISEIQAAWPQITSPRKELIEITDSGDPSHHVIAGDIMSPDNSQPMVEQVLEFLAQD